MKRGDKVIVLHPDDKSDQRVNLVGTIVRSKGNYHGVSFTEVFDYFEREIELVRDNTPSTAPGQAPEADKRPSEAAYDLALELDRKHGLQISAIAAALQKLMDERDQLEAGQLKIQERAEAAEKERDALRKLWDTCGLPERELVKRAEAAEARAKAAELENFRACRIIQKQRGALTTRSDSRQKWRYKAEDAQARAEAAEGDFLAASRHADRAEKLCDAALASKAQLIREVREWRREDDPTSELDGILDAHEQGTADPRPGPYATLDPSAGSVRVEIKPEHPDTVRLRELVRRLRTLQQDAGDGDVDVADIIDLIAEYER